MPGTFAHVFDTPAYKGEVTINTGLFIDGQWVDSLDKETIDVVNPATGKLITSVSIGSKKDVDIAVEAARNAYRVSWGFKCPGAIRGKLLNKLADLMEQCMDEFAALEALNVGKIWSGAKSRDTAFAISVFRYYAGWADKIQGKSVETNDNMFTYTRHEPYGVVGQIIPWNFPLIMLSMKIAPALATGNAIVLKPSELTPLSALKLADLMNEAGFPSGVVNIINGYGNTVGQAIAEHPQIQKIAFTGSTLTGRKIMKAAAESNLKDVSLELGGKNPTIIFDDADLEQALKWATYSSFDNMGELCISGSRVFVQESIYDEFMEKFMAAAKALGDATGDPFADGTQHGPQISQTQFDRVIGYIESGKTDGATIRVGGGRHGDEGYFIQPTIFSDVKPEMKIAREEIFGPVAIVIKFKTEEEVIEAANASDYGLACYIFSENVTRAIRVIHALEGGIACVNCAAVVDPAIPFGGYKQSGNGRDLGEYALNTYTQVKGIHINVGMKL